MRNISFSRCVEAGSSARMSSRSQPASERGFPVLGGVAPGEHLLEEVENVVDTRVVVFLSHTARSYTYTARISVCFARSSGWYFIIRSRCRARFLSGSGG